MVEAGLWLLLGASWIYWLVATRCVERHFRSNPGRPGGNRPPVSVLKPVKGIDAGAYENFASFCRQDYPEFEILFGVADRSDPVVPLIRQLQREFPRANVRLVVAREHRANPKSSLLCELSRLARHDTLVISDSDIRVTPDYLERVVAPLDDPQVGAVTCPYRSVPTGNLPARLEALSLNAGFLPEVATAEALGGMSFALGATIALRRGDLERIGGYEAIADYLSDDYHLGARIAGLGRRVVLSEHPVTNVLGAAGWRDSWSRQARWARSIRGLRPWQYAGLLATFTTPLALALAAASGGSAASLAAVAVSLLVRWWVGRRALGCLGCPELRRDLIWLPLGDLLAALVWIWGWMGRSVRWRGRRYLLLPDNRLQMEGPPVARRLLAGLVRRLDAALRRRQGIYEFSSAEACVLRLSVARAGRDVQLADGTRIAADDAVGELHFWNEHLPRIPPEGPDLAWGLGFARQMAWTLRELARHVEGNDRLRPVRAFRGRLAMAGPTQRRLARRIRNHWDMEIVNPPVPRGPLGRLHAWGESLLLWLLIWAFNPAALKGLRVAHDRREVWISRAALLERFGTRVAVPADRRSRETIVRPDGLRVPQ